jgi:hypothetical protein
MRALIFKIDTGEIVGIFTSSEEQIIQNQVQEGEDYLLTDDSAENMYINSVKKLVSMGTRPSEHHFFDYTTKSWELETDWLINSKENSKAEVNRSAGITINSRYPTYRQINYNREPTAQATIEMNLWIDGVRAESNIATSSIDSATDLATIESIVDGFKVYLAGL